MCYVLSIMVHGVDRLPRAPLYIGGHPQWSSHYNGMIGLIGPLRGYIGDHNHNHINGRVHINGGINVNDHIFITEAPPLHILPNGSSMPITRCAPFTCLSQLDDWTPTPIPMHAHARMHARDGIIRIPSANDRVPLLGNHRRIIHCHDMAGGYGHDYCSQGHYDMHHHAYTFKHWPQIDIFIYFSHSRVTIPPAMWINAAHTNETLILGTYITEWQAGMADNIRLLDGPPHAHTIPSRSHVFHTYYADKLVQLAW